MSLKIKRDDLISAIFFYLPFCMYTFCYALIKMTTISTVLDVSVITSTLMNFALLLLLVKIILSKMTINSFVVNFFLILLGLLTNYYSNRNDFLAVILFILAGCRGVEINKFIKCSLCIHAIIMFGTLIACIFGILPDWTYQDSGAIRHSCGFVYPSIVSSLFFYMSMSILYLRKKYNWSIIFLMEALNFYVYYMTGNLTAFAFLAIAFVAYKIVLARENKLQKTALTPIRRGIISLPVVCFFISLLLSLAYKNGQSYAMVLNVFFHNRLRMAAQGIGNYGIHLFGTEVQWVGNGGRGYTFESYLSYNFVDNSYMYIMITYGIIAIIAIILLYLLSVKWSLSSENFRLCFVLVCIIIYSLIEPRLIEIYFNPFVLSAALLFYERLLILRDDLRNGKLKNTIRIFGS